MCLQLFLFMEKNRSNIYAAGNWPLHYMPLLVNYLKEADNMSRYFLEILLFSNCDIADQKKVASESVHLSNQVGLVYNPDQTYFEEPLRSPIPAFPARPRGRVPLQSL